MENALIEGFYIELNLRKKKWLLCYSYIPHRNSVENHLDPLSKNLALYSLIHEKFIVIDDFNVGQVTTNTTGPP